ncbi:hypothetical protein BDV18DRAFT_139146 [Aspergillus unguis]
MPSSSEVSDSSLPYFNLGTYTRKISTSSPQAQTWFTRGLIWTYAFNHEEAARCFEHALASDPSCVMAYWGLAYTLGPNYNKPWEVFDQAELERVLAKTHAAVIKGKEVAASKEEPEAIEEIEKALIDALTNRYPTPKPGTAEDRAVWNRAYADAMSAVYTRFSTDLDVAALYADSLMNLTPWDLWDIKTGQPNPDARTLEIKSILEEALTLPGGLKHPGLLHLYIHLMEMSPFPENALSIADNLRGLVPDAGHLNHMPTHLDILCGEYKAAMASNSQAIESDKRFVARRGAVNFYTLYRAHNYHFRIYAAMFAGQSRVALETARELEEQIPEDLLRVQSPPMADWLEGFLGVKVHVLVRFGRWSDLLALPAPTDKELYCATTAMIHYGRGIAYAATGRVAEAEQERANFQEALKKVPASRTLFNNTCVDILSVASAMLAGEIEYRKANFSTAFEHLRHAVHLDDTLPYDEPWGWMQPTRHALGALLLEQGKVEEAAAVYAADLGYDDTLPRPLQHAGNIWALTGYLECLERLGKDVDAAVMKKLVSDRALEADVQVGVSCFCRLSP